MTPAPELPSKEVASLKSRAQDLEPAFQVGKSGVTDGVVAELAAALDRDPLVKVKLLKSALESGEKRAIAEELAARTESLLVEVRGFTAVYYKQRRGRRRAGGA